MYNDIHSRILKEILRENPRDIAQPHLIVGENGSGKTTLLKQLGQAIQNSSGAFKTLMLDGRKVFGNQDISDALSSISDSHKKRIVLLLDDIDYYLERCDNTEQFALRAKVMQAGAPILIASANSVKPQLTNYESAFFDAFRIHYLRPLTSEENLSLLPPDTDQERAGKLMAYLPRTIQSVQTCKSILEQSTSAQQDLDLLVQRFSESCKMRFDSYPHQAQRILCALAPYEQGLPLQGLRENTRQTSGQLSPYLKLMVDKNLLLKDVKGQRGATYRMSDPLLRQWLLH